MNKTILMDRDDIAEALGFWAQHHGLIKYEKHEHSLEVDYELEPDLSSLTVHFRTHA
jgi:hypothetical protein